MSDDDPVFLSTLRIGREAFAAAHPDVELDADGARVLRSVLMKPEHEPHVPWLHDGARQSNRETVSENRPVKAVPPMLRTSVPGPAVEPTTTGLEPATSTASKRV